MESQPSASHLCTLRRWPASRAGGEMAWRTKVTHVLSGETRYFREWQTLLDFLVGARSVPFTG